MVALEFSDNIDPTALATVGLALITIGLLVAGWRSLRQNQRQIKISQGQLKQTQEEIALSRREVEEAHRPVVVPIVEKTAKMDLGADAPGQPLERCPQLLPKGRLFVPVRNIGSGPALNVEASIGLLDDEDHPTSAAPGQIPARIAGLGISRLTPLLIELPGWGEMATTEMQSYSLKVEYDDVAGKSWRTLCIYIPKTGRYEGMTIESTERDRPLSDMVRPVPPDAV
jgi:hypothetical protein